MQTHNDYVENEVSVDGSGLEDSVIDNDTIQLDRIVRKDRDKTSGTYKIQRRCMAKLDLSGIDTDTRNLLVAQLLAGKLNPYSEFPETINGAELLERKAREKRVDVTDIASALGKGTVTKEQLQELLASL